MKDALKYVRPNILAMEPYSTARDEYSGGSIGVFLDANESPYNNGLNRYPDPHQKELKAKISETKGIPSGNIFLGNGSDEAIDILYRVFCCPGRDNAVIMGPSYGMYSVAAEMNDIKVISARLEEDFSLDEEKLLGLCDSNTRLIFLCSPNNPTGGIIPVEKIERLLAAFDGIVVVDEAYIDFADVPSLIHRLGEFPNLVVLQTMSKAWGLAGIRLGLAFADERIISIFNKVKYPYNINVLAQRTALATLDEGKKNRQVEEILSERSRVIKAIEGAACVQKVYPTDANFVLVKVDDPDGLYNTLISNGVIVRNRNKVEGCKGCLRITIGRPSENDRLIAIVQNPEASFDALPSEGDGTRKATIQRSTRETKIFVNVDLDTPGTEDISTGIGFFDHMLAQLPHHGGFSLTVKAKGDLEVDQHHTIEDTGICVGEAIAKALGSKVGINRYGFVLPMDECDAMCLIDFGGRIDFQWNVEFSREMVGDMPTEMFKHFFKSVCEAMKCNLHIEARGENEHHKAEAVFKAFARAVRMAVAHSTFQYELPSSKGLL